MEKAKSIDEPERKKYMVQSIANFMKMAYVQWNKDSVTDESILADLHAMSGGELKADENMNLNRVEYRPAPQNTSTNNRGRSNNQNNRGNNPGARTNNNNNPRNNNNQNNRNRNNGGGSARKY